MQIRCLLARHVVVSRILALAGYVFSALVSSEPEIHRVPHLPLCRPLGEFHFGNE